MTIKKKLAISALSVSLIVGSLSILPANVSTHYNALSQASAAVTPSDAFLTRLHAIYTATSSDGKADIVNFKNEIAGLSSATPSDLALLNPILTVLDSTAPSVNDAALFDFIQQLTVALLDPTATVDTITSIKTNNQSVINALSSELITPLVAADFVDFLTAVQDSMLSSLNTLTVFQLAALYTTDTALTSFANTVFASVLAKNTVVGNLLTSKGISASVLSTVATNFSAKLSTEKQALQALALAYFIVEDVEPVPSDSTTAPPAVDNLATKLLEDLTKISDQIANATGSELDKLVNDAVNASVKAVEAINSFNSATMKTVVEGKVIINADGAALQSSIGDLAKARAELKKLLDKGNAGDKMPKFNLKLDIGEVKESQISFKISKDTLKDAIDAKLDGIEMKTNDVSLTMPLDDVVGKLKSVNLNISKSTKEEAKLPSSLKNASDVYNFEFYNENNLPITFTKPVTIKLPISNVTNIDADLLTLAKIINGKLEYYGGKYNTAGKYFESSRKSFSSYVIVENKVSFDDIASVQSWAGRQIQVVAAKGAVEGKAEGKFAPKDLITRAEFAKMLVSALQLTDPHATSTFSDVKASEWFAPYVAAAAELGIIQGKTATTFAPKDTITRAEMSTMIARALKATNNLADVTDADAVVKKFTDAGDIISSLKAGVAFAADKGLVFGYDGKFSPNANATRAEAAVILYRTFNYSE